MSKYAASEEPQPGESTRTQQIKDIFNRYDLNGDGSISCQELGDVMNAMGHEFAECDLLRIFSRMDANGDQRIQFAEFIDWIFDFADLSDRTEMEVRASLKASTLEAGSPAADCYKPNVGGADALDFKLEFAGEEPDLPSVVSGLQLLGARKLREVFEGTDVSKKGFLRLGDIRRILFPHSTESQDTSLAVVKVFAQMDRNSDGKIHCGEFVSYLMNAKSRLSADATESDKRQIAGAFATADADHSNNISHEEFEHMFGAETEAEKQMLQAVFGSVDKNGDGTVSVTELAKVYGKELVKETKGITVSGSMDAGDDEGSDDE